MSNKGHSSHGCRSHGMSHQGIVNSRSDSTNDDNDDVEGNVEEYGFKTYLLNDIDRRLNRISENRMYRLMDCWMDLEQLKELQNHVNNRIKDWEKNGRPKN